MPTTSEAVELVTSTIGGVDGGDMVRLRACACGGGELVGEAAVGCAGELTDVWVGSEVLPTSGAVLASRT